MNIKLHHIRCVLGIVNCVKSFHNIINLQAFYSAMTMNYLLIYSETKSKRCLVTRAQEREPELNHRLYIRMCTTESSLCKKMKGCNTYWGLFINWFDDKLLIIEWYVPDFTPRESNLWCQSMRQHKSVRSFSSFIIGVVKTSNFQCNDLLITRVMFTCCIDPQSLSELLQGSLTEQTITAVTLTLIPDLH